MQEGGGVLGSHRALGRKLNLSGQVKPGLDPAPPPPFLSFISGRPELMRGRGLRGPGRGYPSVLEGIPGALTPSSPQLKEGQKEPALGKRSQALSTKKLCGPEPVPPIFGLSFPTYKMETLELSD